MAASAPPCSGLTSSTLLLSLTAAQPPPLHSTSPINCLLSESIHRGLCLWKNNDLLGELYARLGERLCLLWYCHKSKREWEDQSSCNEARSATLKFFFFKKVLNLLLNSHPGKSFWESWLCDVMQLNPRGFAWKAFFTMFLWHLKGHAIIDQAWQSGKGGFMKLDLPKALCLCLKDAVSVHQPKLPFVTSWDFPR